MSVRDWLEPMLREWGAQRRRILSGRLVRKDGSVHEDGWPTTSVAAAANEGGITGGSGTAKQHFAEVYSGDAMLVWRAIQYLEIDDREVLHLHYVVQTGFDGAPLRAEGKAEVLAVSLKQYYIRLREAECTLGGIIRATAVTEASARTA